MKSIAKMTSATSLKPIRLTHHYIGLFFSPTILFFAITGGLQMFGLHETARGSSYVPPNILVHLSQLHKKGTLYLPPRKPAPPNVAKPDGARLDGQGLTLQSLRKPRHHPTRSPRRSSLPPLHLRLWYQ